MTVRAILFLGLLGGCGLEPDSDGFFTGETDTGTTSGCPSGLSVPAELEVSVTDMTVNGIQTLTTLGQESWNGQPPACASPDGFEVEVLLRAGTTPFAWFSSAADDPTNESLIATEGVVLDAFGYEPPTSWGPGDWYQGTRTVTQANGGVTHTVNGSAESGGRQLQTLIEVRVTP